MSEIKRTAVIGDFSGVGKKILDTAAPILAAAGVEVRAVPTAEIFAGAPGVPKATRQWKDLGPRVHAILCGLTADDAEAAALVVESFCQGDCFLMIDPLPNCAPPSAGDGTERLCRRADVIVPNVREAARLLGEDVRKGPYDRRYVERLLRGLCALGPKMAVVKGIWFAPELLGAAGFDSVSGSVSYAFSPRVPGEFSGTGDLFAAALLAGFLNRMNLVNAMQLAVDFMADCMRRARESGENPGSGLKFESSLPKFARELGLGE